MISATELSFSFEAFLYKNIDSSKVYLHCELLVCTKAGSDSRCDGCSNKKRRRRSINTDGRDLFVLKVGPISIVENKGEGFRIFQEEMLKLRCKSLKSRTHFKKSRKKSKKSKKSQKRHEKIKKVMKKLKKSKKL